MFLVMLRVSLRLLQPGSLLEAPAGHIRSPHPGCIRHCRRGSYISAMNRGSASAAALMAAPVCCSAGRSAGPNGLDGLRLQVVPIAEVEARV
jgi:hypothetical protein